MKIVKNNFKFRDHLAPRKRTDGVVVHHQAGNPVSAAEIHKWHLNRKTKSGSYWAGIGYHLVIQPDGTIEEGRPISMYGAHAGSGANGSTIGICLTGNLDLKPPTDQQMESLRWSIQEYIEPLYEKAMKVTGHKDHMPTSCPGKFFPMAKLHSMLKTPVKPPLQVMINDRKFKGKIVNIDNRLYIEVTSKDGPALIQLKAFAELLGARLIWVAATNTAHLTT